VEIADLHSLSESYDQTWLLPSSAKGVIRVMKIRMATRRRDRDTISSWSGDIRRLSVQN
jgi:hypothetical protein